MATDESSLRALASTRDGLVSWREAHDAGFTWRSIATRVNRGSWVRVGQALIIRDLHRPGDLATAWLLHMHYGPDSIVSGPVAMRLQGWDVTGSDHLVIKSVPVAAPPGYSSKILRRADRRSVSISGCPPLAPRLDALADALVARSRKAARELLDYALQRRWLDAARLEQVIHMRSGPGPRGQQRLRELLARATSGSRSEAEQVMRHILAGAGLPDWVANYAIHGEDGRIIAEIDFANPALKIAIEVDGRAFHSDRQSFERDRERQNMLVLRGWIVLRFTWERLVNDPEGVLAEVIAACDEGLLRLRAHTA